MNQLFRFGLILGIICLVATMVLAVTYEVTKPKIEAQLKKEEDAALREILPQADVFTPKTIGGTDYFEARRGGALAGYCLKVTGAGYGGYIRMIAGIDPSGTITGIRVLEHQETPGLGARIAEVKSGAKEPWFLAQFRGRDARTVEVPGTIDAITGATISSKAVTDAVRSAAAQFLQDLRSREGEKKAP